MIAKKDLLTELINKQRKNIPQSVLLGFKDLNRIVNNIDKSIFDNECTIWKGFIHSYKNNYYINFFYKGSKKNLSRLLYYNFIEKIDDTEYIKNTCVNGGKCCNITHYKKFKKEVDNSDKNDNLINNNLINNNLINNNLINNNLINNNLINNNLINDNLINNNLINNNLIDDKNDLSNDIDNFKVIF
jgi:hypothetical protein